MTDERFPFVRGAVQRGRLLLFVEREQARRAREQAAAARGLWIGYLLLALGFLCLVLTMDRTLAGRERAPENITVSSPPVRDERGR